MNDAFESNGEARIAVKTRWHGLAVKFGYDPNEERERTSLARITKVRVCTRLERFDRITGRDLAKGSIHVKPRRLVAYRLAGQEWVGVPHHEEGK